MGITMTDDPTIQRIRARNAQIKIRSLTKQLAAKDKEIERLKRLVFRMSILDSNSYPEPMREMIAVIYNEIQRELDNE